VILVTHTEEANHIGLPSSATLAKDYPLIDVVTVTRWNALQGDKYLPGLYAKLGKQLRKINDLQRENVHFVKPLMEHISVLFGLDDRSEVIDWHGRQSISVDEFRIICETLNGRSIGEQDAAVRSLESFGYIARYSSRLDPETRLLNPRFINYFLFQQVIKKGKSKATDGFMSRSLLQRLLKGVPITQVRKAMVRVMKKCLVMFEWGDESTKRGYFVPDLLPTRASVPHVPPKGVLFHEKYQPKGFLREDRFFQLLAAKRKFLRVAESECRHDGETREIRVFRDECVLGDAARPVDDQYRARLSVDVIAERVTIEIVAAGDGADPAGAEKFAGRVLGSLEEEAGCGFDVIDRPSAVRKPNWDLRDLQLKAEKHALKYGFILPQKFFAMILGCPRSSLSTVIRGKSDGTLKRSDILLGLRQTKKTEIGRLGLRKGRSLDGSILDSTPATLKEEESPEWRDMAATVARLSREQIWVELSNCESGKAKAEALKSLRSISDDVLQKFLVKRRLMLRTNDREDSRAHSRAFRP
jgi:hypothetical protein